MSIKIDKYDFEPYSDTNSLEDRSGVYVILDHRDDGKHYVLDVGESAQVRTRVENHDRKDCWDLNREGNLCFGAYYTPGLQQAGRMAIEQEIRDKYNPPCGQQ